MKNFDHLPEKFSFKLDEIGKRWIRETFGSDFYDDDFFNYFSYPNFSDEKGFKEGHHGHFLKTQGFPLISTDKLFPPQSVPTIEKGVIMLVWDEDEDNAKEKEVIFFDGNLYYARGNDNPYLSGWQNAKPIPEIHYRRNSRKF